MSSRGGGGGKPSNSGGGEGKEVSSPRVEQVSQGIADISLGGSGNDGDWEVFIRKAQNKAGNNAAKTWGSQNSNSKTWEKADTVQKPGMWNNGGPERMTKNTWSTQASDKRPTGKGNNRPQSYKLNDYIAPQGNIPPSLEHGANVRRGMEYGQRTEGPVEVIENKDYEDDEDGGLEDSSDDYDSDESQKSHETRKKNRWFKVFFEKVDSLTLEEINEPGRHWHCPACQNGPGSIDWFRGLQPLVTHAKTKGSRVNLHREFAELLEDELHRRGTSVIPTPDRGSRAAETSSMAPFILGTFAVLTPSKFMLQRFGRSPEVVPLPPFYGDPHSFITPSDATHIPRDLAEQMYVQLVRTSSLLISENAALVALVNQMQARVDLMESSFRAERESLQRKLDWWESTHPNEHYPEN